MNSIAVKAYAKINLGLDVIQKRPDGYHDIKTIMQTVNLYDTVCIKKTKFQSVTVRSNLNYLPTDQRNLAYKAVLLFRELYPFKDGLNIYLNKRIPVSAGLAGGSADAAATLKGLNQLYKTGLSLEELMAIGARLGADVPFCLLMGTALAEGIGERLKPLPPLPDCHILLVKPDISVSTKYVYENLRLNEIVKHPDIESMLDALKEKNLYRLSALIENIMETVTAREYPVIEKIKEKMKENGALSSVMSGSGPTIYGIFDNQLKAETAYNFFKSSQYGKYVILTKPYNINQ
ncbi:4-diphosphocytidyl-2-C-methyl-D-erythritol kinase [Herbinix hemicellulosilytica]|uniref:4-diphosphocytidyl-2-C-methyl-D-erythritol kinase n=1 Tax=Herbinix hemicellulosilytica TaxID=1564487 RepID=A0A0H5SLH7_HERHM|nr:4-(cytidine 5'-diphospho)-2-C-methyl-D-erythritol kinase [Herbinix hemicellulosilytica]RBP58687.1 4-diphosphocytidyl-2-C-methyl-D-erythritol kinase [Herbinix hemicellulosilytica]CRZ35611.1 4-diphosphocytidyl-2-C-methyl-D-erythritolkinase [Herbinix hemicellulosilytica]